MDLTQHLTTIKIIPSQSSTTNYTNPTEPKPPSISMIDAVLWTFIGLTIIIFNAVVLLAITFKKSLHSSVNVIMSSMFFGNILFAAVYIFPRYANPDYKNNWLYCSLVSVFAPMSIAVVNLHLMAVSIDRLFILLYTNYNRNYSTLKNAAIAVVVIWIVSAFITCFPLLVYRPIKPGRCYPWHIDDFKNEAIYNYVVIGVFFVLPLVVMIICYTYIFIIVRTAIPKGRGRLNGLEERIIKRNYRLAISLSTTVLLYVLMWTPFFICYIITLQPPESQLLKNLPNFGKWLKASQYLAFSFPAVNPLIYAIFSVEIRNTLATACARSYIHPSD